MPHHLGLTHRKVNGIIVVKQDVGKTTIPSTSVTTTTERLDSSRADLYQSLAVITAVMIIKIAAGTAQLR